MKNVIKKPTTLNVMPTKIKMKIVNNKYIIVFFCLYKTKLIISPASYYIVSLITFREKKRETTDRIVEDLSAKQGLENKLA